MNFQAALNFCRNCKSKQLLLNLYREVLEGSQHLCYIAWNVLHSEIPPNPSLTSDQKCLSGPLFLELNLQRTLRAAVVGHTARMKQSGVAWTQKLDPEKKKKR